MGTTTFGSTRGPRSRPATRPAGGGRRCSASRSRARGPGAQARRAPGGRGSARRSRACRSGARRSARPCADRAGTRRASRTERIELGPDARGRAEVRELLPGRRPRAGQDDVELVVADEGRELVDGRVDRPHRWAVSLPESFSVSTRMNGAGLVGWSAAPLTRTTVERDLTRGGGRPLLAFATGTVDGGLERPTPVHATSKVTACVPPRLSLAVPDLRCRHAFEVLGAGDRRRTGAAQLNEVPSGQTAWNCTLAVGCGSSVSGDSKSRVLKTRSVPARSSRRHTRAGRPRRLKPILEEQVLLRRGRCREGQGGQGCECGDDPMSPDGRRWACSPSDCG